MSPKLLLECVLPVGLSTHVTTVLATTPGPEESWFMKAIRLVIEGTDEPLIPLKRAYQPCEMHAKTRTPWVCTCKVNQRATWKNPERERQWAQLWFTRQDTFIAENLGVQAVSTNQAFHPEAVARLRERPRRAVAETLRYIFITIDPAEGGSDEFAIVASACVDGASLIVRSVCATMCAFAAGVRRSQRGAVSASSRRVSSRKTTAYAMASCRRRALASAEHTSTLSTLVTRAPMNARRRSNCPSKRHRERAGSVSSTRSKIPVCAVASVQKASTAHAGGACGQRHSSAFHSRSSANTTGSAPGMCAGMRRSSASLYA